MKKRNKTYYLLFLIEFTFALGFSQELVPNGNFEDHMSFVKYSQVPNPNIQFLKDWKINGMLGNVAYCHKDMVKIFGAKRMKEQGYIYFDTLSLFDGNAMVKLDYGENCPVADTGCATYIKTKLTSPLDIGNVYEVSMWAYTSINPAADTNLYSHIGLYLSRHELVWKSEIRIPSEYYFYSRLIPGQWTEIKWYIRALCTLEYITIGAFKDDAFPSLFRGEPANDVSYFIDKVSIRKVNEDSLSSEIHPTPYCEYYEKEEKQRVLESITSLNIHYASNNTTLNEKDKTELDSFYQANLLRKNKIFIISGYADIETAENTILSKARAESVKLYLHQKYNIPEMTLLTFGFGSSHPVADNKTAGGRFQNRRVTIRTSDMDISKLIYRTGLQDLKEGHLESAYSNLSRWLRLVPMAQQVQLFSDLRLDGMKKTKYWRQLVGAVREKYSLYKDSKNAFLFDSMYFEDQLHRGNTPLTLGGLIEEIDTVPTTLFRFTNEECEKRDSVNFLTVRRYIDKYGYPEISNIGRRPTKAFGYIILHHFDSLTFVKTLPILKSRCEEGEADWIIFARMTDKLDIIKKIPQEYGTQFAHGPDGELTLYKIDSIAEVNKRRARLGLSPTAIPE